MIFILKVQLFFYIVFMEFILLLQKFFKIRKKNPSKRIFNYLVCYFWNGEAA